ncbi:MAG: D-glycerate dehydrogenase [Anaerolineae bacterium]|nr:D-glycerate dehydrogenase [Anaerolineae bacterium]NIN96552.1 D-glycerate dehydrogenase [Anaerolineae bacterium]NIQ79581.1 D-glycerate dehydrogenase [Anaerolineae bacterium]
MAQRPKVYVTRRIPKRGLDLLRSLTEVKIWQEELPPPRDVLLREAEEADGLLTLLTDTIDADLMDASPCLRVVSNYAIGYDNIDVQAATERGIMVCHTPGVLTDTTADFTFTLLACVARRVVEGVRYVREGRWKTWGPMLCLGYDLHRATLGLVGLGRIGSAVAKRATGFEMRILYHDIDRRPSLEEELNLIYADLETVLRESDFISLHTPLTPETYHMIGAEQFKMMKNSAILVNTSRGQVVDQHALYEALVSGEIAGAGLDVTDPEPIPADDPLLKLDNCVVVPHIASASIATRTLMASIAAENLVAALQGRMPRNPVNPEVLDRW